MAKIKEPKLVGVNKHNKISEPKREETLTRYLNWKYFHKNKSNKYVNRIKKAFFNLPEIQEAATVKEDLGDAVETVTHIRLGDTYKSEIIYITDLPEIAWNNKDEICLMEEQNRAPKSGEIFYTSDSELGEAIEDYEEYKDLIQEDKYRVKNILSSYDSWDELFAKYPIFRNLWEEDLDELYPGSSPAWSKKNADRLKGEALPSAGPSKADREVQEIFNNFNAVLEKVDLEKVHPVEKIDTRYGDETYSKFCRAAITATPEFEKAMAIATQIVENLKANPAFIRSTNLAAKYEGVVPVFDYVTVDFGGESLNRKIEVPKYVGLKTGNSSSRSPYFLSNSLLAISSDLKVGALQECIEFSVASLETRELYDALLKPFAYETTHLLAQANGTLKDFLRSNEKAVAIYNKLREENGIESWHIFEDQEWERY